jgi:hypothetical protein
MAPSVRKVVDVKALRTNTSITLSFKDIKPLYNLGFLK